MAIITQKTIYCDIDGCKENYTFTKAENPNNDYVARGLAKRQGWEIINGRDICPNCKNTKTHKEKWGK